MEAVSRSYVVDGTNLLRRLVHASENHPLYPVHSFLQFIRGTVWHNADVVVCWDSPPYWRRDLFPDYKGNRAAQKATEEDKRRWAIFANCKIALGSLLPVLGMREFALPGYEADDLIALYTGRFEGHPLKATVVSTDKDLVQLLAGDVVDVLLRPGSPSILKKQESEDGVAFHQWVYTKVLTGDRSDGIPGFEKIGPARAAELLARYTLPEILEAVHSDPKLKKQSSMNDLRRPDAAKRMKRNIQLMHLSMVPFPTAGVFPAARVIDEQQAIRVYEMTGLAALPGAVESVRSLVSMNLGDPNASALAF